MMSVNLATLGLLKTKECLNKGYGILISFIDMAVWPKFGYSSVPMREAITNQFYNNTI